MKNLITVIISILFAAVAFGQQSLGTGSVQTSASGTAYVALATSGMAHIVYILNNTGTDLSVKVGNGAVPIPVYNGSGMTFRGLSTLAQLSVKRTDDSASQVTVVYMYEN